MTKQESCYRIYIQLALLNLAFFAFEGLGHWFPVRQWLNLKIHFFSFLSSFPLDQVPCHSLVIDVFTINFKQLVSSFLHVFVSVAFFLRFFSSLAASAFASCESFSLLMSPTHVRRRGYVC